MYLGESLLGGLFPVVGRGGTEADLRGEGRPDALDCGLGTDADFGVDLGRPAARRLGAGRFGCANLANDWCLSSLASLLRT